MSQVKFEPWVYTCIQFWIIIHQIFSLARDWSKRVTWATVPQLKLGNIRGYSSRIFPNFQNCVRCEKDLKDNKHNSLHLGRKYARIFVLGNYLFLVAHSFPWATLSENCSQLGTDNVRGQISWDIFAPNGGYCLFNQYNDQASVIIYYSCATHSKVNKVSQTYMYNCTSKTLSTVP